MQVLTFDEFQRRLNELIKAERIFVDSGVTNNITIAFKIYLEILAEEHFDLFISNKQKPFHNIERPLCSECGKELKLDAMPRLINGVFYPSTWVCSNCGIEYYTDKTPRQWYEELHDNKR